PVQHDVDRPRARIDFLLRDEKAIAYRSVVAVASQEQLDGGLPWGVDRKERNRRRAIESPCARRAPDAHHAILWAEEIQLAAVRIPVGLAAAVPRDAYGLHAAGERHDEHFGPSS